MPEVDPELLTVLRLLQAAFGDVEVLEVIDDISAANQPQAQGWTFDDGPAPEESPGTSYLEDAGIHVVGDAADGAEGVELTAALRPDVVLMDWRMPGLDGVQATARIRQQLPEVQVVMFTPLEGAGIGAAAREAGASALWPRAGRRSDLRSRASCRTVSLGS